MGELINIAGKISDSQIPGPCARDAEFIAADAAHVAATDPHLQYATQARGDARYPSNEQGYVVKTTYFAGMTPPGGDTNFLHYIDNTKIIEINCMLGGNNGGERFPPAFIASSFGGTGEYNIFTTATRFYIVCGSNKTKIVNQPYIATIIYLG